MKKLDLLKVFITIVLFASCGEAEFSTGNGPSLKKEKSSDATKAPSNKTVNTKTEKINWDLSCGEDSNAVNELATSNISGGGSFVTSSDVDIAEITIKGKHCLINGGSRDILFVVDVSNSMLVNDPISGGSCGRLIAFQQLMNTFGQSGDIRYGLVTFASKVVAQSTNFFNNATDLIADLDASMGGTTLADVLCHNELGTDFNDAFAGARNLIVGNANPKASKNLFLFSDGQPLFGQSGASIAADLKATGVVIGTIMMEGSPAILRDELASKDPSGKPIFHKLTSIQELGDALADLATPIQNTTSLKTRNVGDKNWTEQLFDPATSAAFTADVIKLVKKISPNGIEIEIEYDDPSSTGRKSTTGSLK